VGSFDMQRYFRTLVRRVICLSPNAG